MDGILDHKLQDTYLVLVHMEDSASNQHDKLITSMVNDVNKSPIDITWLKVIMDKNIDTTQGIHSV